MRIRITVNLSLLHALCSVWSLPVQELQPPAERVNPNHTSTWLSFLRSADLSHYIRLGFASAALFGFGITAVVRVDISVRAPFSNRSMSEGNLTLVFS